MALELFIIVFSKLFFSLPKSICAGSEYLLSSGMSKELSFSILAKSLLCLVEIFVNERDTSFGEVGEDGDLELFPVVLLPFDRCLDRAFSLKVFIQKARPSELTITMNMKNTKP